MEFIIPNVSISSRRVRVGPRAALNRGGWLVLLAASVALALVLSRDSAQSAGTSFTITSPDTAGDVGFRSSIVLDSSGFPVIAYSDSTNSDVNIMHCNDPVCAGGNESITSPNASGYVEGERSLALDAFGFPVVSYFSIPNNFLQVLHCNDVNCAGGDESITSPDPGTTFGGFASLVLDDSGFPVVSYYDANNGNLKLMHCDDANCAGTNESVTAPDTGGDVGRYTSLVLDASGFPVVAYSDFTDIDLDVLHCNDPNCALGGDSYAAPDIGGGSFISMALDASGFPVISYQGTDQALEILHCNDANCAGANESITTPDATGHTAWNTSLVLDSAGSPLVSYIDGTSNDLAFLDCNDANCVGGDDSIVYPDTSGGTDVGTSLALDANGLPAISYYDATNFELKVARKTKPNLELSITNIGQYALPKTCFEVRDTNQVALFIVCDNDFQGPAASHAACIPDGVCEDEDPADGRVRVTLNSDAYRLVESKAPPRHAADPGNQLCAGGAGGSCALTFVNAPDTRPWFPWDLNGDGAVSGFDFFQLLGHFTETK